MFINKLFFAFFTKMSSVVVAIIAPLTLISCSVGRPDAKSVLNEAAKAMGAMNLRTIEFSGNGSQFVHGQPLLPYNELPRFNAKSFNYVADYATPGSRQEIVRTQALN